MDARSSVATVHAAQRRSAPWPYADLDLTGHRLRPVSDVVLKVHQRCNLACDYCYVYEQADQTWRHRPPTMPADVWRATVAALARHARRHDLPRLRVVLHGGEPLLLGADRLGALVAELRGALPAGCAVDIGLQTNGVLLDAPMIATLRRHRVRAGVSVDGTPADHDRHRLLPNGRGTSAAVARALELLRRPENRSAYAGVLCTVQPETDPVATFHHLRSYDPPMIDFLLPHANWNHRPPEPLGDWLTAAFDAWYDTAAPPPVRLFDEVIRLLMGGAGRPAAAHDCMPPSRLRTLSQPWPVRYDTTWPDRPPERHTTTTSRSAGISAIRTGTSIIGRWCAPGAWPAAHSSGSRTSSR